MTDHINPDALHLYTSQEVAALFRVGNTTIARWAREGRLGRPVRPGGAYRFPAANIHHAIQGGTFDQEGNPIP